MAQLDLFGKISNPSNYKIQLSKQADSKDKKKKSSVNSKLKKLSKLKKEFEALKIKVVEAKGIFDAIATPYYTSYKPVSIRYIRNFLGKLEDKAFTNWQKDYFVKYIVAELEILDTLDIEDPYFSEARDILTKYSSSKITEEEKMMAQEFLHHTLAEMGLDLDDIELDIQQMGNADYMEELQKKIHQKMFEKEQESKIEAKKEKGENTDLKFKKLYKALVKKVHPDVSIFSNEDNEHYIKQLTEAWEARNYYKLLTLNHLINPAEPFELDSAQLESIEFEMDNEIETELDKLENIKESMEYNFYYDQFFNSSTKIQKDNILEFLSTITMKENAIKERVKFDLKTKASTKRFFEKQREIDSGFGDKFGDFDLSEIFSHDPEFDDF